MRIAILGGAGAMGGIFGGWLQRAGNDLILVDISAASVEFINAHGLSIEEKDGSTTHVEIKATTEPAKVGRVDLFINFVKCDSTQAAVTAARPMIGADTAVLSLQNGWGNASKIAALVGDDRVLVGLTYHSGTLLSPGRVKHPGIGVTFVGELTNNVTPRLTRVAEHFRNAGSETVVAERILDEVWKKLALNWYTLPTSGLLRFSHMNSSRTRTQKSSWRRFSKRSSRSPKAQGIAIDYKERWAAINGVLENAVGGKASMLQDVEASRKTEIEVINGAIVEAGRLTRIPTPVNEIMVAMISALQAKYLAPKAV